MKSIILVVLLALMLATPCFADEIETDSSSSIEGTLWGISSIVFSLTPPFVEIVDSRMGFYQGRVYSCSPKSGYCSVYGESFYIDSPEVSIAYASYTGSGISFRLALIQPSRFGLFTHAEFRIIPPGKVYVPRLIAGYSIGVMSKIEDNWTPESRVESLSITPDQGEQESTLIDVLLTSPYAPDFKKDGVKGIFFSPPDGLTVSNINVISNTEIEFDVQISADAPIGFREVIVVTGGTLLMANDAFEVLPKTE